MPRQLRVAALAIAVMVAFSSISLAQYHDDDDGYHQGILNVLSICSNVGRSLPKSWSGEMNTR
jgi:hypothetical protein